MGSQGPWLPVGVWYWPGLEYRWTVCVASSQDPQPGALAACWSVVLAWLGVQTDCVCSR